MARTRTKQGLLRSLAIDAGGSMLPIAAISLVLLASLVGGGIDLSRAYQVKNRLQYACDAAVLAGRKAVDSDGFDTNARNQANAFFNGNFDEDIENSNTTSFTPSTPDEGNTIEGVARTTVSTVVMRIFGFDAIPLTATCSASMSVGNSDVMMVLDTTGSMLEEIDDGEAGDVTRLRALQDAMKSFYDTVTASTEGSSARVRFGFVPYSSTVNVGGLLQANWLVDSYDIQSREPVYETVTVEEEFVEWGPPVHTTDDGVSDEYNDDDGWGEGWDEYPGDTNRYESRNDCRDAIPADAPWANYGEPTTETDVRVNHAGQRVETETISQTQVKTDYECARGGWLFYRYYYIVYRQVFRDVYHRDIYTSDPVYETVTHEEFDHFLYKKLTYDVSAFKTGAAVSVAIGEDGEDVTSVWNGCIEERQTVSEPNFAFSQLLGMSPDGAFDLQLDSAPDPALDNTKWRPMWPEVAFYRTERSGWRGWQLTNDAETLNGEKANSYCPYQSQLLAEMTEEDFDDYADNLVAVGSTYHDIGMIWGGRLASPEGIFATNVNETPANGGSVARHLIFMTDGQMQPSYLIQSAYGIEYHDRRVTDDGSSEHTSRHRSRFRAVCEAIKAKGIRIWVIAFGTGLTSDLETCASTDSAYTASDAEELESTFQEIAKDVGELRVVQ